MDEEERNIRISAVQAVLETSTLEVGYDQGKSITFRFFREDIPECSVTFILDASGEKADKLEEVCLAMIKYARDKLSKELNDGLIAMAFKKIN